MILAAMISFGILLLAWILAPATEPRLRVPATEAAPKANPIVVSEAA